MGKGTCSETLCSPAWKSKGPHGTEQLGTWDSQQEVKSGLTS